LLAVKIKNGLEREIIDQLDIPAALKDLLISCNFTIEQLLNMKSGDIAEVLRIDQDVARLIRAAVKKYVQERQGS
jgi:hypothetical protein